MVLIARHDVFITYISSTTHCVILLLIFGWKCFILFQAHLLIYGKNKIAVIASQKRLLRWPKLLTAFLLVSTLVSLVIFSITCSYHWRFLRKCSQALEYNYIIFNGSLVLATGYFFLRIQVVQRISS